MLVVGTLCPNGRANFAPVSWNTPVSEEPPAVAIAVGTEAYTRECLDFCGEASLNVLSLDDAQLAYDLGSTSGREVDKVSTFGLELVEGESVRPPGLSRSLAILESRVLGRHPVGETVLYVLEVRRARVRGGVADRFGYLLSEGVNVLLHGSGRYFYGAGPRRVAARRATR